MPKYTVRIPIPAEYIVRDIEADNPDEAIEQVEAVPSLCYSCSSGFDFGEGDFDHATAEEES